MYKFMQKRSKSYKQVLEKQLEKQADKKTYELLEGIQEVLTYKRAKFEESVELHLNMNLKGTKGPQSVRGSVLLPKPVGKNVRLAVLAEDEAQVSEAKKAGADIVGGKELIEEIKKNGGIEADVVICVPDFMKMIAPVARILGPKGLMPSPKNGTVTADLAHAIGEFKAGKSEYRMDKSGVIHQNMGKVSFTAEEIHKNIEEFVEEIRRNKPEAVKGDFVKNGYLCLTQSPSIKVKI
jgi:large subunit ribosomal protein L1